jgi:hypothetical protein
MRKHRTKDRREPFRSWVFGCVSGFSVTFQNNRLGRIDKVPGKSGSPECGVLVLQIPIMPAGYRAVSRKSEAELLVDRVAGVRMG